jgi:tRNA(Ile)-lysidine synthase
VSTTKPLTLAEFSAALAWIGHWEHEPFLAVAVSGGADSLALTLLADRWARERGGQICALTVDHRLRPESGEEIRRLQGWLSARAIRHEILAWSGDKPVTGIQEAARAARYALLDDWCRAHGCLHLLTAHHREDQADTYLLRRRAGSGANGLAGMSAIRDRKSTSRERVFGYE